MEAVKTVLFLLSILVALLTAGLVAVGGGDGRWEHEGIHRLNFPPQDVFEWVSEPQHRPRWIEGLRTSEEPIEGLQAGAVIVEKFEVDGVRHERRLEITDIEYGKRFAYTTTWDGVDYGLTYEFAPLHSAKKTKIDFTATVQYHGFWPRLMEPVLAGAVREQLYADLERLTSELAATGY